MSLVWFLSLLVFSSGSYLLSKHTQTVYQSTVAQKGVPFRGVDDNHSGMYPDNGCTQTYPPSSGNGNWWLIDLGQRARIDQIKIWNRSNKDCCEERINGATVWVDDIEVGVLQGGKPLYHLRVAATGRYVRVTQDRNILTLCEVEVYGNFIGQIGAGPSFYHPPILVSRRRPTMMSGGSNSHGAVDGVFLGASGHNGGCARTDKRAQNWWQVNLGQKYLVSTVVLYASGTKGRETLLGARVFVDNALCGVYGGGSGSQILSAIKCPFGGLIGTTVKVVRQNNIIELCEAEVFGVLAADTFTNPPTTTLTTTPTTTSTTTPTTPTTPEPEEDGGESDRE